VALDSVAQAAGPDAADQTPAALEVVNATIVYRRTIEVVNGVSLRVPAAGAVALLGANGAGKTSLLRAASGLLPVHDGRVTAGAVTVLGSRADSWTAARRVRAGLAHVLEGRKLFPKLTLEENLLAGGHTLRARERGRSLAQVYDLLPALVGLRRRQAGYLSGGEQQLTAIGRALMTQPRLLLLDEPTLGLAPQAIETVTEIVRQLLRNGVAVLIVEQNARVALSIADHGYVLENGRIVMDEPAHELLRNRDIQEFYLGLGDATRRNFRSVKHYKRRKRWAS
jgi:branched-chain amino acid transport system ATP-binding protein